MHCGAPCLGHPWKLKEVLRHLLREDDRLLLLLDLGDAVSLCMGVSQDGLQPENRDMSIGKNLYLLVTQEGVQYVEEVLLVQLPPFW